MTELLNNNVKKKNNVKNTFKQIVGMAVSLGQARIERKQLKINQNTYKMTQW